MNLNKILPKYLKQWEKQWSPVPLGSSDSGCYIVIESKNASIKMFNKNQIDIITQETILEGKNLYFFELFKYLVKYNLADCLIEKSIKKDVVANIRSHLIKNFVKKNNKNNIILELNEYHSMIKKCFNRIETKESPIQISLVIQKRIGYKYYENIVYK